MSQISVVMLYHHKIPFFYGQYSITPIIERTLSCLHVCTYRSFHLHSRPVISEFRHQVFSDWRTRHSIISAKWFHYKHRLLEIPSASWSSPRAIIEWMDRCRLSEWVCVPVCTHTRARASRGLLPRQLFIDWIGLKIHDSVTEGRHVLWGSLSWWFVITTNRVCFRDTHCCISPPFLWFYLVSE